MCEDFLRTPVQVFVIGFEFMTKHKLSGFSLCASRLKMWWKETTSFFTLKWWADLTYKQKFKIHSTFYVRIVTPAHWVKLNVDYKGLDTHSHIHSSPMQMFSLSLPNYISYLDCFGMYKLCWIDSPSFLVNSCMGYFSKCSSFYGFWPFVQTQSFRSSEMDLSKNSSQGEDIQKLPLKCFHADKHYCISSLRWQTVLWWCLFMTSERTPFSPLFMRQNT